MHDIKDTIWTSIQGGFFLFLCVFLQHFCCNMFLSEKHMEKKKVGENEEGACLCVASDLNGQGSNLHHKNNQKNEFK